MSYSYVNTVFPNFKYSNVYDTKLYEKSTENLNEIKNVKPLDSDPTVYPYTSTNVQSKNNIEMYENNQQNYHIPLPEKLLNALSPNNEKKDEQTEHMNYTRHILECESCKNILIKQFNIENDKLKNEEIMELISFIIFGIFILLLLDTFTKTTF